MFITPKPLFVKQKRASAPFKFSDHWSYQFVDLRGGVAPLHAVKNVLIREQSQVFINLPIIWIKLSQRDSDLDSRPDRFEYFTVGYYEINAAKVFVFENRGIWLESDRYEPDARQISIVQICRQFLSIDPRCADDLERRVGSAAHADVCRLEQADTRIKRRLGQRTHIRRRVDPCLTGFVEPHRA